MITTESTAVQIESALNECAEDLRQDLQKVSDAMLIGSIQCCVHRPRAMDIGYLGKLAAITLTRELHRRKSVRELEATT